jgi:hypothetical protein
MIARAKGRHFLVYHGADDIVFDDPPAPEMMLREAKAASLVGDT